MRKVAKLSRCATLCPLPVASGEPMAVRVVIAVTDSDWFARLRDRLDLPEVNFWSPSSSNFRALSPGELFLFKLHAPHNFIVGGGIFAHSTIMPCSLAWQAFEQANGADSLSELRARIQRYRKRSVAPSEDPSIGCRLLTQPVFLPQDRWLPVPSSWQRNTQRYMTLSTDDPETMRLWDVLSAAVAGGAVPWSITRGVAEEGPRFGAPHLIRPRLGQGAFRLKVTDSYHRRCAVTGERTLPALEAAHIRPYAEGGVHEPCNGLLMRRDVHSLFDAGYVTVTPELRFEVSARIREEYENGRHYYAMHGQQIATPSSPVDLPDRNALIWHNENRFRG